MTATATASLRKGEIRTAAGVASAPAWRTLYRSGAASAGLFLAFIVTATVLAIVTPPAPVTGGEATLAYIAEHRSLYVVQQQLWLVPGLFAMVVYVALYPALREPDRGLATLGAALGAAAWALTLAMPTTSTGAPALVYLSDQWTAASDPSQRALFVAAAEGLIAIDRTPTVVGVLAPVAMLITSAAMLRAPFARWIAALGIATGAIGIASEALRPVIEGGYALYGMLMLVWFGAVGWRLRRLGWE
ncbi:MAG: DUF4386 family protein [Chloroflexota bacterium]|nr:DUF4386 family protein [Chloroflexota bacterium]MDE3192481.1 DUF4386 family protein [Chloroflexota bacterium]